MYVFNFPMAYILRDECVVFSDNSSFDSLFSFISIAREHGIKILHGEAAKRLFMDYPVVDWVG